MALSRSEQMSRIRGKDTAPEQRLRSALWSAGLRYRLHTRTPHGRPDVVFIGAKVAVFIDGCFWHGCPAHYVRPRTRCEFWAQKLWANVDRDRLQTNRLEDDGWKAVRVLEHRVFEELPKVVDEVAAAVAGVEATTGVDWRVVRVEVIDEVNEIERRHLVALRDPRLTQIVEGRRMTTKWRRPPDASVVRRKGAAGAVVRAERGSH